MKKHLLHRVGRKLIYYYRKKESLIYSEELGAIGKGSYIEYPAIIGHPELIKVGEHTQILSGSRLQCYSEEIKMEECGIEIGNSCFITFGVSILATSKIKIGDNVLIASNCCFVSHNHGMNPEKQETYMQQPLESEPITIGNGCWIGEQVMVMPGVTIGKCCIVGAGAVVTDNIPDYSIAVGCPSKVIKTYNFDRHCWECVD